jgi:DNA-binding NarL/FixJ family response regulator
MTEDAAAHHDDQALGRLHDIRVLVLTEQPLEGEAVAALLRGRSGADAHWVRTAAAVRKLVHGERPTVMLWMARDIGWDEMQPVADLRDAVRMGLIMLADDIARDALAALLDRDTQSVAVVLRSTAPTLDDLAGAIEEVHRGRSSLDPQVLGLLLDSSDPRPLSELTDAEREVAELVAGGLRNVAIGEQLSKSERTVEKHVASIFDKLGLSTNRHPELDRRVATARIVLGEESGKPSS